jgi:hypothetical protein
MYVAEASRFSKFDFSAVRLPHTGKARIGKSAGGDGSRDSCMAIDGSQVAGFRLKWLSPWVGGEEHAGWWPSVGSLTKS